MHRHLNVKVADRVWQRKTYTSMCAFVENK